MEKNEKKKLKMSEIGKVKRVVNKIVFGMDISLCILIPIVQLSGLCLILSY